MAKRTAKSVKQPASAMRRRVLVISHSHPELTKGGAEIAAYNQYLTLTETAGVDAWFLGCARNPLDHHVGAVFSQPFGEREYIYACGAFDWFNFSNMDPQFPDAFRALLQELQPDEVHFHHYINIGLEAILHVRETLPDCRITMTLHEYLAICHHYGQMVTKPQLKLCSSATYRKCVGCFPENAPEDFFLRQRYIERLFSLVDQFVSPSQFLAERYIQWGIDEQKISVIENIVRMPVRSPRLTKRAGDGTKRIGIFGQISVLKGINVVFEAAQILDSEDCRQIVFEIYGDDAGQPPEFQKDFRDRLAAAGNNVIFMGPYERSHVAALMEPLDLVLVPSIWWENSPLVIQEALALGVPVGASDLGGMREKVDDSTGVNFRFAAGNHVVLVSKLKKWACINYLVE